MPAPGAQQLSVQGKVQRPLYGPAGDVNGALLDDGTIVRMSPPAAYQVAAFNVSLGWEIKTNNLIEDKGIHVYSKDADITAYEMSHNSYTSDGMYVIPPIGWGNDYVVAAYAALAGTSGNISTLGAKITSSGLMVIITIS